MRYVAESNKMYWNAENMQWDKKGGNISSVYPQTKSDM